MATCSKIAIRGMRPIAAPSSEQISTKLNDTVEFVASFVILTEKAGKAKDGKPGLISPVL